MRPVKRQGMFTRPVPSDQDWRHESRCADTEHDAEMWFSPFPAERLRAMGVCSVCPVRPQCLSWATMAEQRFGIWGGVDFEVASTSNGVIDEAEAVAATVARLPLVDRAHMLLGQHPGVTMAQAAEILGYKSAGSLERTLYRRGDEGKKLIRVLKPGSRSREQVVAEKVTFKGISKNDPDHPWLVEAALPVNEQGANVQHRKTGKPGRREGAPTDATEEDAA